MAYLKVKYAFIRIFLFFLINKCEAELTIRDILPEIPQSFIQMALKMGLPCEKVQVTTEDGYILDMFYIPGSSNKSYPVLIQSGNLGTSDDYITRGKTSLPYVLWSAGYDVWMGNVRGCRYGRRHVTLNPDVDDEFWNFSIHEFGVYDTPAMIDYILNRTQAPTLTSIGWSFGTSVNYIMATERPEYKNKVDVIISLAPIYYLQHSKPYASLVPIISAINYIMVLMDINEFLGERSIPVSLFRKTCSNPLATYDLCMNRLAFPLFGYDEDQIENKIASRFLKHYPSSTSRKNIMHQMQITETKTFAEYDYGPRENMKRYGSTEPKEYNLSKNQINVVLISGKNDLLSTLEDVEVLKTKLSNIVDHIILKPEKFNHIDFAFGRDTHKVLYEPIILDLLNKYKLKSKLT